MTKVQRFEDWKKRLHLRGRGRFGLPHLLMSGFAVGVILGLLLIGALPVPGASWLARAFPKYQVCVSSAQRAILVTSKLPPLPAAFPNSTLTVHYNFQYQR